MHNLISYNQLAGWKQFETTLNHFNEQSDVINDYYQCLIECDDKQHICKKICKEVLNQEQKYIALDVTRQGFYTKIGW